MIFNESESVTQKITLSIDSIRTVYCRAIYIIKTNQGKLNKHHINRLHIQTE